MLVERPSAGAGSGPAATEEGKAMFEKVYENLRAATESNIQLQQELFKKWMGFWLGAPGVADGNGEPFPRVQKKFAEFAAEVIKKQHETWLAQFNAGLKNIEEAFHLPEAKDPEELRTKTIELWKKSFNCLRETYEAQVRDFQATLTKWTELVTKSAA
jgi:hypothetical protein